jgi:hypothetical protein
MDRNAHEKAFSNAKAQRAQRGKAATKFWIFDFRFWIEEKENLSHGRDGDCPQSEKSQRSIVGRILRVYIQSLTQDQCLSFANCIAKITTEFQEFDY